MKQMVLIALLAVAFPLVAFANSVDFSNLPGTLALLGTGVSWLGCCGSQKEIMHGKIQAATVTAHTEIAVFCA